MSKVSYLTEEKNDTYTNAVHWDNKCHPCGQCQMPTRQYLLKEKANEPRS